MVLVEPGLIVTEFGESVGANMAELAADDAYGNFNAAVAAATKGAYDGPMKALGGPPERVARAIERAISSRRPPARVTVTPSAKLMLGLRKLLPDRAWDATMKGQFPQPH